MGPISRITLDSSFFLKISEAVVRRLTTLLKEILAHRTPPVAASEILIKIKTTILTI